MAGTFSEALSSSKCCLPEASLSGKMSASATRRAVVFFAKEVATAVPRLPQPSRPRRTAELAGYPKAVEGLTMSRPEAAAVVLMKSRLSMMALIPPECAFFRTDPTFGGMGARFAGDASELQVLRCAQLRNFCEHFFEIHLFLADVFDLFGAVGFALDGDGAGVAGFAQADEDFVEVDQAGADQDLFA